MPHSAPLALSLSVERERIDASEIDELAGGLAQELSQVDGIDSIARVGPADPAASRSKVVGEAIGWGQIALSLAASGGVLVTLIAAIKEWLVRQPPSTTIKMKLGSDELEITSTESEHSLRLVREFLKRHG